MATPPPTDHCKSAPGAGSGSTATRPANGPRGGPGTGKSARGCGPRPRRPRRPRRLPRPPQPRPLRRELFAETPRAAAEEVVPPHRVQPQPGRQRRRVPTLPRRGRRTTRRKVANPRRIAPTDPRPAPSRAPLHTAPPKLPRRSRRTRRAT